MKWYQTNLYEPMLSECAVLVAVHSKETDNIFLALAVYHSYEKEWHYWEHKGNIEDENNTVLFYCYPDPIPKVYDHLTERSQTK